MNINIGKIPDKNVNENNMNNKHTTIQFIQQYFFYSYKIFASLFFFILLQYCILFLSTSLINNLLRGYEPSIFYSINKKLGLSFS